MFEKVLVGADDSATARRAVETAAEIAAMSKSELHIASAHDPKSFNASSLGEKIDTVNTEGDVDSLLQVLSFVAQKYGLEPVLHASHGDPANALVRIADEIDADLIVVGNRGMKGVRRVLGSVPNSVAHEANCSVLIVDTTE
jgi:nucleotide-binding universal stress UspA family protein